jgi:glycosyltransferase involved in cell wall biosynthesis
MGERRVFYVSYDGAQEPLGRSQIIPYLVRLAADYEITLISFEKSEDQSRALATELAESGIDWIPLRYHRRPPVLSTALDVLRARGVLRAAARRRGPPAIVHVRSYVPALMARGAANARLLFDIRGFWADERVEGGLWRPGGGLYHVAKRFEQRFFSEADAIVTLTETSIPQIREWTGGRDVPIEVIPTCVDLERFGERPQRPGGPHTVWSGSIGTWYRFDLTERIARALGLPLTVLTLQTELARSILAGYPASVQAVAPERLPGELYSGDVGLCLIASSFSKIASAPTRFGEYLAAGMPVLVTRGVGDLEQIVTDRAVGIVLEGEDETSIALAAERLRALAADEQVRARCRATARDLFDVKVGAARYAQLYSRLLSGD